MCLKPMSVVCTIISDQPGFVFDFSTLSRYCLIQCFYGIHITHMRTDIGAVIPRGGNRLSLLPSNIPMQMSSILVIKVPSCMRSQSRACTVQCVANIECRSSISDLSHENHAVTISPTTPRSTSPHPPAGTCSSTAPSRSWPSPRCSS